MTQQQEGRPQWVALLYRLRDASSEIVRVRLVLIIVIITIIIEVVFLKLAVLVIILEN